MNIPNGKIDQKNINIKMTNIIYYDENIDKYIKSNIMILIYLKEKHLELLFYVQIFYH